MTNRETLARLRAENRIRIGWNPHFDAPPAHIPSARRAARFKGMMLGLAIGDALGNTTEGHTPQDRRALHGEIRDFIPHPIFGKGFPSDDTQLAFWTLEQILDDGRFNPERFAEMLSTRHIFGIGATVLDCIRNVKSGKRWYEAGPRSAGNGSLMRIAPVLGPHIANPSTDLWADTALAAMLTHNDSAAIASCLVFVSMLWDLMRMNVPPPPEWWPETWIARSRGLEIDFIYEPRQAPVALFRGALWQFIEREVPRLHASGLPLVEACDAVYSGAYLLETVPAALLILMRHAADPQEAIVRAATDTKDNDTIAAIVGAAVGALHGDTALPRRWLEGLTGRTRETDDGQVFRLLARAEAAWLRIG